MTGQSSAPGLNVIGTSVIGDNVTVTVTGTPVTVPSVTIDPLPPATIISKSTVGEGVAGEDGADGADG